MHSRGQKHQTTTTKVITQQSQLQLFIFHVRQLDGEVTVKILLDHMRRKHRVLLIQEKA